MVSDSGDSDLESVHHRLYMHFESAFEILFKRGSCRAKALKLPHDPEGWSMCSHCSQSLLRALLRKPAI
jgi:hypothetical protein